MKELTESQEGRFALVREVDAFKGECGSGLIKDATYQMVRMAFSDFQSRFAHERDEVEFLLSEVTRLGSYLRSDAYYWVDDRRAKMIALADEVDMDALNLQRALEVLS